MNLSRVVREIAARAAVLLRHRRPVPSIETAVETIRRFQDGRLTERASDAIADALIRFHQGSLTQEAFVEIATTIGQNAKNST
jgi:aminoglycoside phosphotransferase family enzyme